jgi:hypothetical protein
LSFREAFPEKSASFFYKMGPKPEFNGHLRSIPLHDAEYQLGDIKNLHVSDIQFSETIRKPAMA